MEPTTLALAALFVGSAIRLAMPMLLGAIGELVSERAGVLNLSIEGMMLFGAFAGAMGSLATSLFRRGISSHVRSPSPAGGGNIRQSLRFPS